MKEDILNKLMRIERHLEEFEMRVVNERMYIDLDAKYDVLVKESKAFLNRADRNRERYEKLFQATLFDLIDLTKMNEDDLTCLFDSADEQVKEYCQEEFEDNYNSGWEDGISFAKHGRE